MGNNFFCSSLSEAIVELFLYKIDVDLKIMKVFFDYGIVNFFKRREVCALDL
jgi:hypothetical protein